MTRNKQRLTPRCADCGRPMALKWSKKFNRQFFSCTGFPKCKGSHGADPDGKPLGTPGNAATKQARRQCHELFDVLWKDGHMPRGNAYRLLARLMDLTCESAHIGNFSLEQCEKFKEKFMEWQTGKNPEMQFLHLVRGDIRRMLEQEKPPFDRKELEQELERRIKETRNGL